MILRHLFITKQMDYICVLSIKGDKHLDRRKRKSQKAIFLAFLALSQKQEIEKITINEIAQKADVSRGTVYLNFEDKYDLLDKLIQHFLDELFFVCNDVDINEKEYFPKIVEKMYLYLDENSKIYTSLFTKPYFSKFRTLFETNLLQAFQMQTKMNHLTNVSVTSLQFLTAGITGCIVFWLQENKPTSPKEATLTLNEYLNEKELLTPFIPKD